MFVRTCIALVWVVNGLYCKVLGQVPRHREIVARILGDEHAGVLTSTIGVLEVLMAIWIISRIWPKVCTVTQIAIIATMNTIEFTLAPDLLLFGRINAVVAGCFIVVIAVNEYFTPRAAKKQ